MNILGIINEIEQIQHLIDIGETRAAIELAQKAHKAAQSIGLIKIANLLTETTYKLSSTPQDNPRGSKSSSASAPSTIQPDIGVHIHAYYVDVCAELIEAASNICSKKHIYISTCKAENIEPLRRLLIKFNIDQKDSTISLTPNRGRNFGPMLVEFREKLLAHNIVLHLHTKKSLRTGEEQVNWRINSWNSLCGSKKTITKILTEFSNNPKLGLVGPYALEDYSSYWWRCWLSVGHLLPSFFEKLGINKYPKKGFIQFPVGSMFWARTHAISQLLQCEWSYDDFPEEPFPDDGTIAHVIERSLGWITEQNNYRYLESKETKKELGTTEFDLVPSPKLMADYFKYIAYLDHAPSESTISFDFFDTLFTRNVLCPDDIFGFIGHHLRRVKNVYNGEMFIAYRKKAEAIARSRSACGEVNIDEIYYSFIEASNWSDETVQYAKSTELETELKSLIPRRDVIAFAQRAKQNGARLIIVSDTYLTSDFLRAILSKWGLADLFDQIYVSCESSARKDWGTIWPHIIKKENLSHWTDKFIHIGDNEQSDIQQPIRNGIRALGVLNPGVMYDLSKSTMPSGWLYGESKWPEGVILGPIVARNCNSPCITDQNLTYEYRTRSDFGYCVIGPMLFGFVAWLIKRSRQNTELNNLAFVARDGWHLKAAYDLAANFLPKGYCPPSIYLMTSRQALLASADCSNLEQYANLLLSCGYYDGDIVDFMEERASLNIISDDFTIPSSLAGKTSEHGLIALLKSNYLKIKNHTAKNKTGLLNHLNEIGFSSTGGTAIVDLGYAGTIQSLLQEAIKSPLTGYYFALNNRATKICDNYNGQAYGCFGDSRSPNSPMSPIEAYSLYLEAVFTAPHQKITGYLKSGEAILSSRLDPNIEFSAEVNHGALDYIKDLLSNFGVDSIEMETDTSAYLHTFNDFVTGRHGLSAQLKNDFIIDDYFSGNGNINPFDIYNAR